MTVRSAIRLALITILPLAGGCVGEGTSREKTTATAAVGQGPDEADATKDGDGDDATDDGTDDVGSGGGEPAVETAPNSRSLEQCTAEKKAWRAVVNKGQSPADCVESLVEWCCTEAEIAARFPTMASALKVKFDDIIDSQKHVLYHCSFDAGSKRHTFHTAKITPDGKLSYQYVFVANVFPVDTGSTTSGCPQVTTGDLQAVEPEPEAVGP